MCEEYLVNIELPNSVGFAQQRVTKGKLAGNSAVLIGMSIIGMGDFAVTNHKGQTKFSFRCPSEDHIDFVKAKPIIGTATAGRNSPCPCKSGKKYKHCCGAMK